MEMYGDNWQVQQPKKIELHYFFPDESHSMNALIRNSCEAEFLAVAIEVSSILGIPLEIESEALKEGGLKEVWKALGENSAQIALLISSLALIWTIVPHRDQELNNLQKEDTRLSIEERKLSIEKLKKEIAENIVSEESIQTVVKLASKNYKIVTRKSNFYKTLSNYEKVTKIGVSGLNSESQPSIQERIIERANFSSFILTSNELPPTLVSDAMIEIVSPVLNGSRAKWKGIYNEEPISFFMNDAVFRNSVTSKDKAFKNGDAVICELTIHKKLNELGEIITSGYVVEIVLQNIESGMFKETSQGRAYKQTKRYIAGQKDMFE